MTAGDRPANDGRPATEKAGRDPETARKEDEEIDEALEETFPASDPPSYSRGLPTTG